MIIRQDGDEITVIGTGLLPNAIAQKQRLPAAAIVTATAIRTVLKDTRAESQPHATPIRPALGLDVSPFAARCRPSCPSHLKSGKMWTRPSDESCPMLEVYLVAPADGERRALVP